MRRRDDVQVDRARPESAVHGEDLARADHEREIRRTRIPGLLLSDGTMPENLPDESARHDENTLVGMPAAAGVATGSARIVHDPATARIEPGEILVAATTDPGWTPLFLTAGGLVTETGSPMAHGPTVAREYGIPAVICVPDVTNRLRDGQKIEGAVSERCGSLATSACPEALRSGMTAQLLDPNPARVKMSRMVRIPAR